MLRYRFQRSSSFKKKKSHPFVTYNLTSIHPIRANFNKSNFKSFFKFPSEYYPSTFVPKHESQFPNPPLQLSSRNLSIVKDEEGLVAAYRLARRGDSADHLQS